MTILEALTLARDQGVRVRPVCWRRDTLLRRDWIEYRRAGYCQCNPALDQPYADTSLMTEEEFLGEWEVIDD